MSVSTGGPWIEQLAGLRGLAISLVASGDPDDLLQSAVVRAIEHPPRASQSIRSWLACVIRRNAYEDHRRKVRREARERSVARPDEAPATVELVERHDIRLALMRAVKSLDDPYREVILLRFFEGLPPRAISARLAVPVKTIDSRLQRALEKLRSRLDGDHSGDRKAWVMALAPIAKLPATTAMASLAVTKVVAGSVGAIVLAAVLVFVFDEGDRAESLTPAVAVSAAPEHEVSRFVGSPQVDPDRDELEVPPLAAPTPEQESPPTVTVHGIVVDAAGRRVAGVPLRATPSSAGLPAVDLVSDASGRIEVDVVAGSYTFGTTSGDYVSVLNGFYASYGFHAAPRSSAEVVVVVAPGAVVEGIVIDNEAVPVANARVSLQLPVDFEARVSIDLSSTKRRQMNLETDAGGRFRFAGAFAVPGIGCEASRVGYESAIATIEKFPAGEIQLVLSRPSDVSTLEGVVLGPTGEPIDDARVALGNIPCRTDSAGRFEFEYPTDEPPQRLFAVAEGRLPTEQTLESAIWPPFVELHLTEDPLSLAGTVFGPNGEPMPDVTVWVDRTTTFGSWKGSFWIAESVMAGDGNLQRAAVTDDAGKFRIEGLMDRDYELKAMVKESVWTIDAGSFHAGDDQIVIRFPPDGLLDKLAGRVVDSAGVGIEGAFVSVAYWMLTAEDNAGGSRYMDGYEGASATSDSEGRFVLAGVPRDGTLAVRGESIDSGREFPVHRDGSDVELRVARLCQARIDNAPGAIGAASFQLVDRDGAPVTMMRIEMKHRRGLQSAPLVDGRSEVIQTNDAAVAVRFLDAEGNEQSALPIRLNYGELNEIR